MSDFIRRTLQWKLSITKGALYVFIAMASVIVSTFQGWDETYVSTMRWWNWVTLLLSSVVAGANSAISFIDKTAHDQGQEIKESDTAMFKKSVS